MDAENERRLQGGESSMITFDWRSHLLPDSRQRIVNKIIGTLKKHPAFSGQEGLYKVGRSAVTFEGRVYDAASSQSDYLRTISLKMLTIEAESQISTNPSNLKRHRVLA